MTELFREAVDAAERAVAGEIPPNRDALRQLFAHPDKLRSAGAEDRAYLSVLLDVAGLRHEAVEVLQYHELSESGQASAVLWNAEGMLAAVHGQYMNALELFRQALPAAADSPSLRVKILANLAAVSHWAGLAEQAAQWAATASGALPEARDPATEILIASVQADLAAADGNVAALRRAAAMLAKASRARVAELGAQHPQALVIVANMATIDIALARAEASPADLERSVAVLEIAAWRLAAELGEGHLQSLLAVANLAAAGVDLARAEASMARMRQAVNLLAGASQRVSTVLGDAHPQARMLSRKLASARLELGSALMARFEERGNLADLDQAITILQETADTSPHDYLDHAGYLSDLGIALHTRFEQVGRAADLDQAVALLSEAADASWPDHPARPARLSNLAIALATRFGGSGQHADLNQAVALLSEAVAATPPGDPGRPGILVNLGIALQTQFLAEGRDADLDQAIALLSEAVAATRGSDPARLGRLANLGAALQTRFERGGRGADLDQAIALLSEAVDATSSGHPGRPVILSNLGGVLQTRFEQSGQSADLDRAVALLSEAVLATSPGHPGRSAYLSNLGSALRIRYGHSGEPLDLDQAITVGREAVDTTPPGHPDREGYLMNLGAVLQRRFEDTGQLADLDQAIDWLSQAVDATPPAHPARPRALANLGNAMQMRSGRTGQQADLDQAIALLSQAVDATPHAHPDRPARLANLGAALRTRFQQRGQLTDLDQAITLTLEAVDAAAPGQPGRPAMVANLGDALRIRFGSTGQQTDLDQAIAFLSEAVDATTPGNLSRSGRLSSLGAALRTRFEHTGQRGDLEQAMKVFREGAAAQTSVPSSRLTAAVGWGQCALLAGSPASAVEGYTAAIELLPLVTWHGLNQATREHHLREWAGLASDAAAAAVAAGEPARAVELLEAGRSMLWSQALRLRQDLAVLREQAPELASDLEAARWVLNTPSRTPEERRRAARDWDAAVDQVRRITGFEDFLRPVPFTRLGTAADGGPVVIVNISRYGSHALIITTGAGPGPVVVVVDLPAAPIDMVIDQAIALQAALYRSGDPGTDWQARENDRQAVFGVLAWCWQAITEPVLTALGHAQTPSQPVEEWPRVWWCPTGLAAVLPLHASGRHPRTAYQYAAMGETAAVTDSVAGRAVSSYCLTLAGLIRARARPEPAQVRELAVGVPEAPSYLPGTSPLPAVPAELQVVAGYLPPPARATQLLGRGATRQAVLQALPGHSWLHLSCHGLQHQADASLSAFCLYDQPLTLADLASLNLEDTDLAYLAACQTATGDLQLLDEGLHLAGALQLVGYRHVLATTWSISDTAAPAMADSIYRQLTHPDPDQASTDGRPQAARAAFALHRAVAQLRQANPGEPLLWAPYIHLGP